MHGHELQKFYGFCVPTTKRFNDKRLEDNFRRAAVVGVLARYFRLTHDDGGGGGNRGPIDESVLSWRDNAGIEGGSSSVYPPFLEDICWARLGSGNEGGHFIFRVKLSALSFINDLVPNSVVASPANSMVVSAMHRHRVVSLLVQEFFAVICGALGGGHRAKTEAIYAFSEKREENNNSCVGHDK